MQEECALNINKRVTFFPDIHLRYIKILRQLYQIDLITVGI